ncbi:hypothetical protein ACQ4WX_25445 [Streptomyces lasalocidi]
MISSTWGRTSLLGSHPDLFARVLGELPCDEYRVAAIVHPNVWAAHSTWQLGVLQAAALDAGLLLMPPVHAWRAALVAADVVIGDHGSVTLYGASLGTPVLLAAFGADAVPGTAIHALGAVAPRLDARGDIRRRDRGHRTRAPSPAVRGRRAAGLRRTGAGPGTAPCRSLPAAEAPRAVVPSSLGRGTAVSGTARPRRSRPGR